MPPYHFPGYPAYLDAAAAEIGRPEAAGAPARLSALATIANLCAQAAIADAKHVDGILARATEACDLLRVAHRAAELMLIDVRDGRGLSPPLPQETPTRTAGPRRRPRAARPSS